MTRVSKIVLLAACLHSGVPASAQDAAEPYWLGAARGPHATGTVRAEWIDQSRGEQTTSADDRRRILVQVWYPADPPAAAEPAPYAPDIALYDEGVQEIFARLATRPTRSVADAPLAGGEPFPVLLYSPGGGSQVFSGTFITEFLASHGYVVIGVGHTDDSRLAQFADGTRYVPDAARPTLSAEESAGWPQVQAYAWLVDYYRVGYEWRAADLAFALDRLEELNATRGGMFEGRLDLERVGALGWSLGGSAALQATLGDARVKAAVNLDGTLFGLPVEREGSARPLLMIENADFLAAPAAGATDADRAELLAAVDSATWGMFRRTTADWYRATLARTTHHFYSDYILAYETPPEGMLDPAYAHGIINELVLEFFGRYWVAARIRRCSTAAGPFRNSSSTARRARPEGAQCGADPRRACRSAMAAGLTR